MSDGAPDSAPVADTAEMPPARDAEPEPVIAVPTETGDIITARPGDEPLLDDSDALLEATDTLEASVEPETSAVERPIAALPPVSDPASAAISDVPTTAFTSIQSTPLESAFVAVSKPPATETTLDEAASPAPVVAPTPEAPATEAVSAPVTSPVPEPAPAPPVAVAPPPPPSLPVQAAVPTAATDATNTRRPRPASAGGLVGNDADSPPGR